jgi:hypothetical protein
VRAVRGGCHALGAGGWGGAWRGIRLQDTGHLSSMLTEILSSYPATEYLSKAR